MNGFRETEEQKREREIVEARELEHRLGFYVWTVFASVGVGWVLISAAVVCFAIC